MILLIFGPLAAADDAEPTKPSEPIGLVGIASVDGNVTLFWQPPLEDGGSAITEYRVYRTLVFGEQVLVGTSTQPIFVDTLAPSFVPDLYSYVVSAVNEVGEGPPSNTAMVTSPPPECVHIEPEWPFVTFHPDCFPEIAESA